jgi:hypothetical protein
MKYFPNNKNGKLIQNSKKLHINTLVPYFEFKNNKGKVIQAKNCCLNFSTQ